MVPRGGLAGVVKEPRPAPESSIAGLMVRGAGSWIVVSHVRLASRGDVSYINTHPSGRRLWDRNWAFAHNDSIGNNWWAGYGLEWCQPVGETDSEYVSSSILEGLAGLQDRGLE